MKSIHNFDCGSTAGDLSPILTCIRSIQGSEVLWGSDKLNYFKQLSFKQLKSEEYLQYEDGFCFAVSLQDGSTLYISSAIIKHLGYPKDMLLGQCIMNFLYHKDHITFANHLTQGLNVCFTQGYKDESHLVANTFFCRLRVYHGLKFGYGVSGKRTQYKPFKVTLHIKDLIFDDVCVEKVTSTLCVKATATPVSSAYQVPEEFPAMTSFSTRHTASCHFSHVDASAIPYLGYLPQDMIGYSIFDFYHIDDMPLLKDIYELVVKERGSSFRSKPYRFKLFNGSYITLETEWSCFINPWSRKLEFVVGQHRVLKGPVDIDIFNPSCNVEDAIVFDDIVKDSSNIQKEIKNMLAQPIQDCSAGKSKRFCNKRKRDLISLVYSFVDDENENKECMKKQNDEYCSDPDSVVMGDISPHQDSTSSSETPPACQEIRYKENIERFFASQPKTLPGGFEECKSAEKNLNYSNDCPGNIEKQREEPNSSICYSKQQESLSTSSKFHNSVSTTGDSGYAKSCDKENHASVDHSEEGYANISQKWNNGSSITDGENLPLCAALTEESLSQHNRLNQKHVKARKVTGNATHGNQINKDGNRRDSYQNSSAILHQHKKCPRLFTSLTSTVPTQTEEKGTHFLQQPTFGMNAPFFPFPINSGTPFHGPVTSSSASVNGSFPPFSIPSYSYTSGRYEHGTQAVAPQPYFIPVMCMGTMPYYPPVSGVLPTSGVSMWPTSPTSHSVAHIPPVIFPGAYYPNPGLAHTSISATSPVNQSIRNACNVQSSGATATTTVLTTTTTVAPVTLSVPQAMDLESKSGIKLQMPLRCDPPWLNGVNLSPEVMYRYQMKSVSMEDVLMKDMEALKVMTQPHLVNKQLGILKTELNGQRKSAADTDNEFCSNESTILGLTVQDTHNKEDFTDYEDNIFHLMSEDL